MDNVNLEGLSAEQIRQLAEIIAKEGAAPSSDPLSGFTQQPPATLEAPAPPKFTVKIGGREFTGTQEEVQAEFDRSNSQQVAPPAPQQQDRHVKADDGPGYDVAEVRDEFTRRAAKDPVDAFKYMAKYTMGVEDPAAVIRSLAQTVTSQHTELAGLKFRAENPDWEPTPDNVNALQGIMNQYNIPPTFDGLQAAYAAAKGLGKIKTRVAQVEQTQQQPAQQGWPQAPVPQAPPRVNHSQVTPETGGEMELLAQLDRMSPEQIRELDRRIQTGQIKL